jgi:DNA repair exonuclease SbcCD ATPase subunit
MNPVLDRAAKFCQEFYKMKGSHERLLSDIASTEAKIETLKGKILLKEKGIVFFKVLSDNLWGESKTLIETIVTGGEKAIFVNHDIDFKVNFSSRGNAIVVDFENTIDSRARDIIDGQGGGIVDVVTFLLKLALLLLIKPSLARIMVLDEPFKHLSSSYVPRAMMLLKKLQKDFGIQFLIVTHIEEMEDLDCKRFRTTLVDGQSRFVSDKDLLQTLDGVSKAVEV